MKKILFVCTGNTCRSPMAACMARALGYDAASAGIDAWEGQAASLGARRAMQRRGLSLDDHRARRLTREMLLAADAVVALGPSHWAFLRGFRPDTLVFAPVIADPFGGDDKDYEQAACEIERQLPSLLEKCK